MIAMNVVCPSMAIATIDSSSWGRGFDLKVGCGGDMSSRSSNGRVSGSVGKGWWQLSRTWRYLTWPARQIHIVLSWGVGSLAKVQCVLPSGVVISRALCRRWAGLHG